MQKIVNCKTGFPLIIAVVQPDKFQCQSYARKSSPRPLMWQTTFVKQKEWVIQPTQNNRNRTSVHYFCL